MSLAWRSRAELDRADDRIDHLVGGRGAADVTRLDPGGRGLADSCLHAAAAARPKCSSMSAPLAIWPMGLAMPNPAMSGADP